MPLAFLGQLEFQKPNGKCAELDHTIWPPVKITQLRSQQKIIRPGAGMAVGPGWVMGRTASRVLWALFLWCLPPGTMVIGTLRLGPTFCKPYAQKN